VRENRWRKFDRIFADDSQQVQYIREIIFGKKRQVQYWLLTTDPDKLPENSTWYVMTKIPGVKFKEVGNIYGLRNSIEYGLKQSKNELGWADFQPPDYAQIQKWWEIVMSAYLLVSLQSQNWHNMERKGINESTDPIVSKWSDHQWWDFGQGWKNLLNNLRLVMQPYQFFNLLNPWQASFSNYAFINWLVNTNCLNESNARCYPREH
jgi:SRSO17 transposase